MNEKKRIKEILKDIKDPEIGINILDLGLVYKISVKGKNVKIVMTLTSPLCPWGGFVIDEIAKKLEENGYKPEIELTFDPPWSPERMNPKVRKKLGL